jgi:hypothetical protein
MLYANSEVSQAARAKHGVGRLSVAERATVYRGAVEEFDRLPTWRQLPFTSTCRMRRAGIATASAPPVDITRGFFGHGSYELPIKVATCLRATQQHFGLPQLSLDDMPCFIRLAKDLRAEAERLMFSSDRADNPAIPAGLELVYKGACWKKRGLLMTLSSLLCWCTCRCTVVGTPRFQCLQSPLPLAMTCWSSRWTMVDSTF